MRGRPFEVTWRQEDTTEALKAGYQGERGIELRRRLHGLWLLRSGWRLRLAAAAVDVHYRTVQQWVGWYREGGVPEVVSHKMGGIYSLMHRLRCSPKVPRPLHAKADQEQQASWKKKDSTRPLRELG